MKFDVDSSSVPLIVIPLSMAISKDSGVLSGSGGTGEGGLSFLEETEKCTGAVRPPLKFASIHFQVCILMLTFVDTLRAWAGWDHQFQQLTGFTDIWKQDQWYMFVFLIVSFSKLIFFLKGTVHLYIPWLEMSVGLHDLPY